MSAHNYKPGDKVRFIDGAIHNRAPAFYPPAGTIGTVLTVEKEEKEIALYVQWPPKTTSQKDKWYCVANQVKPVEEDEA